MIRPPASGRSAAVAASILFALLLITAPLFSQATRYSRSTVSAGSAPAPPHRGAYGAAPASFTAESVARRRAGDGPALTLGPFIGRLEFADELALPRQELVGASAGLDLTRYFGLNGFYWRGVDSDFTAFQPIQGYGGEAQLSLRSSVVFAFLTAGAGRIEFRSGFVPEQGAPAPEDETALIAGGGVGISLGSHIRIDAAVRDYILGESGLGDLGRTDRLLHNPLFSVGLTFVLTDREARRRREEARIDRERLQQDIERAFAQRDRFLEELAEQEGARRQRQAGEPAQQAPAPVPSPGTINIPVPREGEIYLRYGTPGGVRIESQVRTPDREVVQPVPGLGARDVSPAELRALIREAVREELRDGVPMPRELPPPAMPLEERLDQLERRLIQAIDALIEQRLREREQRAAPAPPPPGR